MSQSKECLAGSALENLVRAISSDTYEEPCTLEVIDNRPCTTGRGQALFIGTSVDE